MPDSDELKRRLERLNRYDPPPPSRTTRRLRRCRDRTIARLLPESFPGLLLRLLPLHVTVARRSVCLEGPDEPLSRNKHLVHRELKGHFVNLRRPRGTTQLAHELERRGPDLFVGCRRIKVRKSSDISTMEICGIGGIGGIGFRQRAPGDQVLLCCTVEGTTTLPRPATR